MNRSARKSVPYEFHGEPRQESYGKVAVFEDLYGNKRDLVESNRTGNGV